MGDCNPAALQADDYTHNNNEYKENWMIIDHNPWDGFKNIIS